MKVRLLIRIFNWIGYAIVIIILLGLEFCYENYVIKNRINILNQIDRQCPASVCLISTVFLCILPQVNTMLRIFLFGTP